jgi:hypothetical protein
MATKAAWLAWQLLALSRQTMHTARSARALRLQIELVSTITG